MKFFHCLLKRLKKEDQKKAMNLIESISDEEKQILLIRESYRKENLDEALLHAKELVVLRPDAYEAYNWLGIVQSDRYEIKDAIKTLERAVDLNKDNLQKKLTKLMKI